jgi:hypothetical protein
VNYVIDAMKMYNLCQDRVLDNLKYNMAVLRRISLGMISWRKLMNHWNKACEFVSGDHEMFFISKVLQTWRRCEALVISDMYRRRQYLCFSSS